MVASSVTPLSSAVPVPAGDGSVLITNHTIKESIFVTLCFKYFTDIQM